MEMRTTAALTRRTGLPDNPCMSSLFQLVAPFAPTGDQPEAIRTLAEGLQAGCRRLTLEG